ncbi:hypothetical protein DFP73DRAFT_598496 [Morchella snyderi]|nr:hypothetical protein DFP73DRAFT_598496 [Morchella snyderi]
MDSTPAYSDTANTQDRLPAYVDSPFLPPPTDDKHKHKHAAPAPQSVWIQDSDISGFSYRRRHVLPADAAHSPTTPAPPQPPVFDAAHSPPTYTAAPAPLYTVKSHGQPSPLESLLSSPPDFTIYVGDGDAGPVVATGTLHTSPLKKSLGELRFFPRASTSQPAEPSSSSSSSAAAREIPAITLKERDDGKKYVFSSSSYDFEWSETGPGERPPAAPPAAAAAEEAEEGGEGGECSADGKEKGKGKGKGKATAAPSFFAKALLRKSASAKASPRHPAPRDTKTWALTARDCKTAAATRVATYTELQPAGSAAHTYSATAPTYRDGHTARLDVHEPAFGVLGGAAGAREFAVASIMLLVEAQRKKIVNARNRGWLDGLGYGGGGGGGGGGGCGGGA